MGIVDSDNNKIPDVLELQRFGLDKQKLELDREKERNKKDTDDKKIAVEKHKADTQLKIAKENKNRFDDG